MFLPKSDYLKFKQCPKYLWLSKNMTEFAQANDTIDDRYRRVCK